MNQLTWEQERKRYEAIGQKPQPQTLNCIKMEKNFTAVCEKGYTRYPYQALDIKFLFSRLMQEAEELEDALKQENWREAQKECADVSNIADYLFEAVTQLKQQKQQMEAKRQ